MKEKYLRQISSFLKSLTDIPDSELHRLTGKLKRKKIKKGEFFVRSGEDLEYMGFIISGLLRCYNVNANGVEFTKHFFLENDFIVSHSDFNLKIGPNIYVEALENSVLLVAGVSKFNELFESHLCWHVVAKKIRERYQKNEERRVSGLLLKDDNARYADFLRDFPGIEKRVKKDHIASYLGISL